MKKLKPGDLAKLKSGGPTMTIQKIGTLEVLCHWFAGAKLHRGYFEEHQLIRVPEDSESKSEKN